MITSVFGVDLLALLISIRVIFLSLKAWIEVTLSKVKVIVVLDCSNKLNEQNYLLIVFIYSAYDFIKLYKLLLFFLIS